MKTVLALVAAAQALHADLRGFLRARLACPLRVPDVCAKHAERAAALRFFPRVRARLGPARGPVAEGDRLVVQRRAHPVDSRRGAGSPC